MSYATIATSAADAALVDRIIAATAQEAWGMDPPDGFAAEVQASAENGRRMIYPVCTAGDVEAAYASALAAGNPDPGGDEGVVTDGMILSAIQADWPPNVTQT